MKYLLNGEVEADKLFPAGLKIQLTKNDKFIKDITPLFGNQAANLLNYQFVRVSSKDFCILVIEIPHLSHLQNIIQKLNGLQTVNKVIRLNYSEFKMLLQSSPVILGNN